jgi:hypothetical protein
MPHWSAQYGQCERIALSMRHPTPVHPLAERDITGAQRFLDDVAVAQNPTDG